MNRPPTGHCVAAEHRLHRRTFLQGVLGGSGALLSLPGLALAGDNPLTEALRAGRKHVLWIWLAGGASQFETWDPKPRRETGGPFRTIPTAVPGYHVCELMPRTAALMDRIAVIRSLNTELSEHGQAADLLSTGRPKEPALQYPEIGVVLAKELALRDSLLPAYVSIFTSTEGRRRPDVGFLGGQHAPLLLEDGLRPRNIDLPDGISADAHAAREQLRELLSNRFGQGRADRELVQGYNSAYAKVRGLMRSDHLFDLQREPESVRQQYGSTPFGRECLLARRLIEAGVSVVKVARGFWDSHHDNFESHRELVPDFDHVFSTLLQDLEQRGLLQDTLVVVNSEFGRTPKINKDVGRDHYARAWSCALAGCGIRGGTIHGRTDDDGIEVTDGQVRAQDLAATILQAVGISPHKHYQVGLRPVPLAKEDAVAVRDVLA
jgi:hypothetical protein